MKKTHKPPARALFKEPKVRELVANAPESAPITGIGSGGRIISIDLDADSPRILANAPPSAASPSPCAASPARCSTS
ncbi:hypothetical protein AB0B21_39945 [Streptomyces rimosus]|uniref:hypothetical protein n=1 Tax=Streptomyces rimosus TaxID=1927 RepID=UPI0005183961|nr:hypothetical protein [Streptomyces rimosus]